MFKLANRPFTQKWSKIMKITVIKKAATTRKPQNFCPWIQDEITDKKN